MKTIHHLTSAIVASGSIAVTLLTLGGVIPAELAFAGLSVLALAAFALFDYARPVKTLRVAAPVLRPTLPATHVTRRVSAIIERAA